MTNYQDLFNNMDTLSTIDPSTISQQDALASLFPGIPSLNPGMIDDWLAEELCKSGLIANSLDFTLGLEKQLAMLPHSPPISPPNSAMSDSSSCISSKQPCVAPKVPLFPEIKQESPKPAPVVTILPKSNLPRIAPRPSADVMIPRTPIMMPPTNSNKRRVDNVVDQDEIALKRQKNTDAARRSRLKKLVKMEQLESRVSDLESDNHRLTTRIAVLESEKSGLESKDISLEERIRVLEAQLAEAHKALTKV
jgi:hypothetical protein